MDGDNRTGGVTVDRRDRPRADGKTHEETVSEPIDIYEMQERTS